MMFLFHIYIYICVCVRICVCVCACVGVVCPCVYAGIGLTGRMRVVHPVGEADFQLQEGSAAQ